VFPGASSGACQVGAKLVFLRLVSPEIFLKEGPLRYDLIVRRLYTAILRDNVGQVGEVRTARPVGPREALCRAKGILKVWCFIGPRT